MDRDQGCHDRCLEAFAGMVAVLAVSFKRVLLYDPIHPVFTLVSFDNMCISYYTMKQIVTAKFGRIQIGFLMLSVNFVQ